MITDALEMRAISAGVGLEEGAVRSLAAGADALCLGHYIGEDDVRRVQRAVLEAVRAGRLDAERVREAAERVSEAAAPLPATTTESDRAVGREAARRALLVEGDLRVPPGARVVELRPEPLVAAGPPAVSLGELLGGPAVVVTDEDEVGDAEVLVVRDAHRHEWQRSAVEAALARHATVVVETGIPGWRPAGATGFVATFGNSRANLEAAAEILRGSAPARR